ncbi:MAG: hypothetical protein A49_20960 [Methyloceanibacter sp.]|nr:MAG: hypothetical protein A49_20960 [Methyloceanibacter sp.]
MTETHKMTDQEHSVNTESVKTGEDATIAEASAGSHRRPRRTPELPDDAIVLLPTRNAVLFPGIVAPLMVGRPQTIAGAQAAAQLGKPIGVLLQSDPSADAPKPDQLNRVAPSRRSCDM